MCVPDLVVPTSPDPDSGAPCGDFACVPCIVQPDTGVVTTVMNLGGGSVERSVGGAAVTGEGAGL